MTNYPSSPSSQGLFIPICENYLSQLVEKNPSSLHKSNYSSFFLFHSSFLKSICFSFFLFHFSFLSAQSLSLDDCLELASQGSVVQQNARLDILAAQAQRSEARTLWFPTVSARAIGFQAFSPLIDIGLGDILGQSDGANLLRYYLETEGRLYGINTSYATLLNGYTSALTLTQPLYAGGRIAVGNRLAALGVEAATLKSAVARRDDRLEVEKKYWLVVSLEDKQQVLDAGMQLLDTLMRDVRSAVDAGLALTSDLMQVQLRRDELVSDSLRLASGLRLARRDLLNTIGVATSRTSAAQPVLTTRLTDLASPDHYYVPEADAAAEAGETRLLQLQVKAKQMERRMALGEALPEVGVGATYGYGRMLGTNPRGNGLVFASVSVPLTDWARTTRKMRRIGYEAQQAENQQAYLSEQLVLRVSQAWEELTVCWQQLAVAARSVETAQTLFHQTERSHAAGMATTAELLQTETTLRAAQNTLTDRRIAYAEALSRYRALTK